MATPPPRPAPPKTALRRSNLSRHAAALHRQRSISRIQLGNDPDLALGNSAEQIFSGIVRLHKCSIHQELKEEFGPAVETLLIFVAVDSVSKHALQSFKVCRSYAYGNRKQSFIYMCCDFVFFSAKKRQQRINNYGKCFGTERTMKTTSTQQVTVFALQYQFQITSSLCRRVQSSSWETKKTPARMLGGTE